MKKILYVVSTLRNSGPTNQLYNLIKHLDRNRFDPYLITLSPEPIDSAWAEFKLLGVKVYTLNLSRSSSIFLGKKKLKAMIRSIKPDLIHTHGIRADCFLAFIKPELPWMITLHNFPRDDYLKKFGFLKGTLMSWLHLSVIRQCNHIISCSKSLKCNFRRIGVESKAIQNGVRDLKINQNLTSQYSKLPRPIYISVGSIIPRKNVALVVEAFDQLPHSKRGSLLVVGDGPLLASLKKNASENVHFIGRVTNAPDYLALADYFVSASSSEGLPLAVLEALALGLPCVLSNIEPHREIAEELPSACMMFAFSDGVSGLKNAMLIAPNYFNETSRSAAMSGISNSFSAGGMSSSYQSFYLEVLREQ